MESVFGINLSHSNYLPENEKKKNAKKCFMNLDESSDIAI